MLACLNSLSESYSFKKFTDRQILMDLTEWWRARCWSMVLSKKVKLPPHYSSTGSAKKKQPHQIGHSQQHKYCPQNEEEQQQRIREILSSLKLARATLDRIVNDVKCNK